MVWGAEHVAGAHCAVRADHGRDERSAGRAQPAARAIPRAGQCAAPRLLACLHSLRHRLTASLASCPVMATAGRRSGRESRSSAGWRGQKCALRQLNMCYSYARCARRLRATRDNSTWPATCISVTAPRVRLVALQNMFGGRNPLVPLGCLATAGVLCRGVLAMYQGDKILSQKMMRGRACTRAAYCCCALPSVCGACSRTSKTRVAVAVHAGPCLTRCDGRLCCAHRHPGARSDCHHDRGRRDCRAHPISAKTTDGGRGNPSGSRTGDGCGTGAEIDRVTSAARLCVGWRVHATEESRKSEHCLVRRS